MLFHNHMKSTHDDQNNDDEITCHNNSDSDSSYKKQDSKSTDILSQMTTEKAMSNNSTSTTRSSSSSSTSTTSSSSKSNNWIHLLEQMLDPIISSPFFATFLFWLPFLANDKLRHRVSIFLSTYLDLNIALPVTAVGTIFAVLYLSYQNRLVDIELAQQTTEEALAALKEIRSAQISFSGGGGVNPEEFQRALENYEYVLRQELMLRSILPGVKVLDAPNDPFEREEDVVAAKMFLGMRITRDGKLEPL